MKKEAKKEEEVLKMMEEIMKSTPETSIDKELLKLALAPKEGEDPFVTIFKMQLFKDMMERQKKGEDIDLGKILSFMAIKTAMQPQPPSIDPNLLIALTKGGGDSNQWSQFMQAYLQQQAQAQQAQQQFNQQLMAMLFGQRMQQTEQQVQTLQESLKDYLNELNNRIAELQSKASSGASKDIVQQLEYELKKKEILEKFAESFKPKEIVTESGKINWGKLLDRAVGIGEKIVEKIPKETPMMREIKTIPEGPIQEIEIPQEQGEFKDIVQVSVQKETPKEPPKKEEKKAEIKKEEKKVETTKEEKAKPEEKKKE